MSLPYGCVRFRDFLLRSVAVFLNFSSPTLSLHKYKNLIAYLQRNFSILPPLRIIRISLHVLFLLHNEDLIILNKSFCVCPYQLWTPKGFVSVHRTSKTNIDLQMGRGRGLKAHLHPLQENKIFNVLF